MTVDLTHPAVAQYLARLSDAARVLPAGRAQDLHGEIRDHLAQALADLGPTDDAAVLQALDRLGPPEDIVGAEMENLPAPIPAGRMPDPGQFGAARPGLWGPVEVIAVLLLTVGVVTVIGPVIGLALAWLSQRWSLRDKLIATVGAFASFLVVIGVAVVGLGLFAASSSGVQVSSTQVSVEAPVPSPAAPTLP
jgi:hypothetical protein